MERLSNRIDIDEISINETRTYIDKNTKENSVRIWTVCIKKEDKKYYIYEIGDRDENVIVP